MARKDGRYILPAVIDPPRICVQIEIPNDLHHIIAFWGHFELLARAYSWGNDEAHTALEVAAVWRDVWDKARENFYGDGCMGCCPDEIEINQRIYNQNNEWISYVFNMMDDRETPQSFAPDAPENFDSNSGDENPAARTSALCDAVRIYVWSMLDAIMALLRDTAEVIEDINEVPIRAPLIGIFAHAITGLSIGALNGLIGDESAVNEVICHMYENLKGNPVNFEAFRDSVQPFSFPLTSNAFQVASIIDNQNGIEENYRAFVVSLNRQYERLSSGGSSDCPCGCSEEIELEDFGGTGCTTTYMGDDVWRFQQNTPDVDGRYRASFRDISLGCLHVEFAPSPYTHQGVGGNNSHGCCGTADYNGWHFGGGFAPAFLRDVIWWTGDPMDTYYKITCVEPEECEE